MFLEKNSRFVRHYRFNIYGRKKSAPAIPLVGDDGDASFLDAIQTAVDEDKAKVTAPNGDEVEIIDIKHDTSSKTLTFLLHRASPDAADPIYRKKKGRKITLREITKEVDEEQSVSCHLIMKTDKRSDGSYDVYLEEIPRLSLSLIQPIFSRALNAYVYTYTDSKGKADETHSVLKTVGVKEETVTNALKGGELGYITLVRPADASFVDGTEFEALNERMKIRIKADISPSEWIKKIGDLAKGARSKGWEDVQIDLHLDDERKKTVKVERGNEGKEILFVRAEQVFVETPLPVCSNKVRDDLVKVAIKI